MTWHDPYHRLGLYHNPFVSEEVDDLLKTTWIDRGLSQPPSVRAKLFVQVRGAVGAGKTSHLLYWQRQTAGVYTCYPPHQLCHQHGSRWRVPPVGDIVYWDEAQAIPVCFLLIALGQAAIHHSTIVAATHSDLSWAAKRVGLTVKTITLSPLDVPTLLQWAQQRIEMARLPGTVKVSLQLTSELAESILAISDNSWRTAATHLHVWAAAIASGGFSLTNYNGATSG